MLIKRITRAAITPIMLFGLTFGTLLLTNTVTEASTAAAQSEVTPVVMDTVCMVTDKVFDSPQIPVEYNGKTYYGCCQGCVSRLQNDSTLRNTVDPVTGNSIDKATATVIKGAGGEALYFESIDTARKYFKR